MIASGFFEKLIERVTEIIAEKKKNNLFYMMRVAGKEVIWRESYQIYKRLVLMSKRLA